MCKDKLQILNFSVQAMQAVSLADTNHMFRGDKGTLHVFIFTLKPKEEQMAIIIRKKIKIELTIISINHYPKLKRHSSNTPTRANTHTHNLSCMNNVDGIRITCPLKIYINIQEKGKDDANMTYFLARTPIHFSFQSKYISHEYKLQGDRDRSLS